LFNPFDPFVAFLRCAVVVAASGTVGAVSLIGAARSALLADASLAFGAIAKACAFAIAIVVAIGVGIIIIRNVIRVGALAAGIERRGEAINIRALVHCNIIITAWGLLLVAAGSGED
jgi:hypothetical protein